MKMEEIYFLFAEKCHKERLKMLLDIAQQESSSDEEKSAVLGNRKKNILKVNLPFKKKIHCKIDTLIPSFHSECRQFDM